MPESWNIFIWDKYGGGVPRTSVAIHFFLMIWCKGGSVSAYSTYEEQFGVEEKHPR